MQYITFFHNSVYLITDWQYLSIYLYFFRIFGIKVVFLHFGGSPSDVTSTFFFFFTKVNDFTTRAAFLLSSGHAQYRFHNVLVAISPPGRPASSALGMRSSDFTRLLCQRRNEVSGAERTSRRATIIETEILGAPNVEFPIQPYPTTTALMTRGILICCSGG